MSSDQLRVSKGLGQVAISLRIQPVLRQWGYCKFVMNRYHFSRICRLPSTSSADQAAESKGHLKKRQQVIIKLLAKMHMGGKAGTVWRASD